MIDLKKYLQNNEASQFGISASAIKKLPLSKELSSDLIESLDSSDNEERFWGVFFIKSLIEKIINSQVDDLYEKIISRISKLLESEDRIRLEVLEIIKHLKSIDDYKSVSLKLLNDKNPEVRLSALKVLRGCTLNQDDFQCLLLLEKDVFYSEVKMNGQLRYRVRDLAFDILEERANEKFERRDETSINDEGVIVSYIDWKPIKTWLSKSKKKSFFSKLFKT